MPSAEPLASNSFSNRSPHWLQTYSYIGIHLPLDHSYCPERAGGQALAASRATSRIHKGRLSKLCLEDSLGGAFRFRHALPAVAQPQIASVYIYNSVHPEPLCHAFTAASGSGLANRLPPLFRRDCLPLRIHRHLTLSAALLVGSPLSPAPARTAPFPRRGPGPSGLPPGWTER